jgi:cell division protein FtsB
MDEKIKNLWNNNKILFILLIIPITLWFLKDIIFAMVASSARKTAEEARKEDGKLSEEVTRLDKEAAVTKAEADAAGKRVTNRKEEDVDEDWHKKS